VLCVCGGAKKGKGVGGAQQEGVGAAGARCGVLRAEEGGACTAGFQTQGRGLCCRIRKSSYSPACPDESGGRVACISAALWSAKPRFVDALPLPHGSASRSLLDCSA